MNNLFQHSPKELTTDGFLTWLIYEVRDDQSQIVPLFKKLELCSPQAKLISDVEVKRQASSKKAGTEKDGKVDLIVEYKVDGKPHAALFENKIHTTIHSNQLENYKKMFPDCQYYKYLKLARINLYEEKATDQHGYDRVSSEGLLAALNSLSLKSEILDQYKAYLQSSFIDRMDDIRDNLLSDNKQNLFKHREAQHYFIDRLYQKLDEAGAEVSFNSRSNVGGTPWTTLRIASRKQAYGEVTEYIFWKIDKRKSERSSKKRGQQSNKYYLRLNQYAGIGEPYKATKKENLRLLKSAVEPILKAHTNLKFSRASNAGVKESEVLILFFEDNNLESLDKALEGITKEIVKTYRSLAFK